MSDCVLCRSQECDTLKVGGQEYLHCPVCDLIQLEHTYYLGSKAERERYEQHNNTSENEGYVKFLSSFMQGAVKPFVRAGAKGLDYGCGPGPVLQELLRASGIETDIFDPFFFPKHPETTYDLVTCTEALEHAFWPREVWHDFVNLLNSGGYLSVMTKLHTGAESFPSWWYRRDPTHVSFYSPKTFEWIERNYPLQLVLNNRVDVVVFRRR